MLHQTPFIVSAVFRDDSAEQHELVWILATDMVTAGAAVVAEVLRGGCKLPLASIRVGSIDEANARKAVALYDEIAQREKREAQAERDKIARLVPRVMPDDCQGETSDEPFLPAG